MKKITIAGVLLLFLASCVTQNRCLQKFPPQIVTKDSIIIKDTTVYVTFRDTIPGDSVLLHDNIPCPDVIYHKEVISPSGKTSARVYIDKGKLTVDCKVDSLIKVIDNLEVKVKTTEAYHSEVKTIEVPVIKNKTPLWAWLLLAVNIFYFISPIVIKLIKK